MKLLAAAAVLAVFVLTAAKPVDPTPTVSTMPAAKTEAQGVRAFVRTLSNMCSGVTLAPGYVLTAAHCAEAQAFALTEGGSKPAVVAIGDDRLDYALLAYPQTEATCPCARLASREAALDEPVFIVGYPLGISQVVTFGTSQGVQDNDRLMYGRRLVTTAQVAGGNSGGGVFVFRDGEYQLVGLLVEGGAHLSFAIPLADLLPFLERAMPHLQVASQ